LAGLRFSLEAYLGQDLLPGFEFVSPITLTLRYDDADIAELIEASLTLRYWDGSAWSSDGITRVAHDQEANTLVVSIAHLTEFGLFGQLQSNLSVLKSVDTGGLAPVPLDSVVTYTLVISNAGPGVPAGLGAVGAITGLTALPPATSVITWGPDDLAAQSAHTLIFTATVTDASYAGQTLTNTAYISAQHHAPVASAPVTFIVASPATNAAPLFTSAPITAATVNVPYSYTITAEDADGDSLTFTVPTKPAWLTLTTITSRTTSLAGTPPQTGPFDVTLHASDGISTTAQAFTIEVASAPPGNRAPTANAGVDQSVDVGAEVLLDGSASADPDGDALTCAWRQSGGPAVSFTPILSRTTFIAPESATVLTFTLTVTDTGGLSTSDEVVITVERPFHTVFLPLVMRK
jgi:hypothetical protein